MKKIEVSPQVWCDLCEALGLSPQIKIETVIEKAIILANEARSLKRENFLLRAGEPIDGPQKKGF